MTIAETEWVFIQYEASTISLYKALLEGHIQEAEEHKSDMDICKAELPHDNYGSDCVVFDRGDKITQLVILPVVYPELELVNELDNTEPGNGGFGSTGR